MVKYILGAIEIIALSVMIIELFYHAIKRSKAKKANIIVFSLCFIAFCSVWFFQTLTPPNIDFLGGEEVTVEVFAEFDDEGLRLTDYKGKSIETEIVSDLFLLDTDVIGDYLVTYSFKYRSRTYSPTRIVRVVDTVPPEISVIGNEVVAFESFDDYKEEGCIATDNYDGDLSGCVSVTYDGDINSLVTATYAVTDSSGNVSECAKKIEIRDITPPIVTLNGFDSVIVVKGAKYEERGANATDNRDGNITKNIEVSGSVDTSKIGTYKLQYTVSDSAGNIGIKRREIKVVAPEKVKGSIIYLTFDDGPSEYATKKILDVLKKNDVKATFFIINFDTTKKADLIKRMVKEGHTVAIHGYSHDYQKIYRSEKAFMDNINSLRDKVKALTGYNATIMRFPGGSSNTISKFNPGIMTKLVKSVQNAGYTYYDWNVDSGDAMSGKHTANKLYNNVRIGLAKNRGNVVLMHDTGDGDMKAKAVQKIIEYGKDNGYVFAPITEATSPVHHPVMN